MTLVSPFDFLLIFRSQITPVNLRPQDVPSIAIRNNAHRPRSEASRMKQAEKMEKRIIEKSWNTMDRFLVPFTVESLSQIKSNNTFQAELKEYNSAHPSLESVTPRATSGAWIGEDGNPLLVYFAHSFERGEGYEIKQDQYQGATYEDVESARIQNPQSVHYSGIRVGPRSLFYLTSFR